MLILKFAKRVIPTKNRRDTSQSYGLVLPTSLKENDASLTVNASGAYSAHATGFETSPKVTTLRDEPSVSLSDRTEGFVGQATVGFTVPTGISIQTVVKLN